MNNISNENKLKLYLKECVNGVNGEVNLLFTFIFHYYIIDKQNIKKVLGDSIKYELQIIDKLMILQLYFKEFPYFYNSAKMFYSTKFVNYQLNDDIFLMQIIKMLEKSISIYKDMIALSENQTVIQSILSIINMKNILILELKKLLKH